VKASDPTIGERGGGSTGGGRGDGHHLGGGGRTPVVGMKMSTRKDEQRWALGRTSRGDGRGEVDKMEEMGPTTRC